MLLFSFFLFECFLKKDNNACQNQPCLNGGTCTSTGNGLSYICSCNTGYSGTNCQTCNNLKNIDFLLQGFWLTIWKSKPLIYFFVDACFKCGFCKLCFQISKNLASKLLIFFKLWSWIKCSYLFQVNACLNSPCLNGGTCQTNNNQATCLCPQFYSGANCQICKRNQSGYLKLTCQFKADSCNF